MDLQHSQCLSCEASLGCYYVSASPYTTRTDGSTCLITVCMCSVSAKNKAFQPQNISDASPQSLQNTSGRYEGTKPL